MIEDQQIDTRDVQASPSAAATRPSGSDRRRPGRPAQVAPALMELLRWRPDPAMFRGRETTYALRAAQGLLIGLVLGSLAWTGSYWMVEGFLG